MIKTLNFSGNPYVGVYSATNESVTLVSREVPSAIVDEMAEALGTGTVVTTLSGSIVLGALVCMNSRGAVVTNLAEERELKALGDLRVALSPEPRLNAMGNHVLCNDTGAVVNPMFRPKAVAVIEETLGVTAVRGTIARLRTVGSAAVATNKGCVVHPRATEEERAVVEEALGVPVAITTANYGTPQVGACLVANTRGAVVGTRTTPIELGRIEDGLLLY